jgi:uncharacterized protein
MARSRLTTSTLTLDEARRLALSAQGFRCQPRHGRNGWSRMARALDDVQLLQIDSVNVLVRSHYLPLFARLGTYDMNLLDARSFQPAQRHFFECWAHEASLVPLALHPLMRWRMARAQRGDGTYKGMDTFGQENEPYLKTVLAFIASHGPTRASEVPGGGKSEGGWWGWSKGKLALETLFDQGRVTTATRAGFERIYDLPERVIPEAVLNLETPREDDAIRDLVLRSAAALGIATDLDLKDYFRLPVDAFRTLLPQCLAEGSLQAVAVEGWKQPAYVLPGTAVPRKAGGVALLSPFDPLVWHRPRAERLFNFHYRIELYTPEEKRKFGYYVLPFLHGQRLSGRLCLKADRQTGTLRVNTAHHESGLAAADLAPALFGELQHMARWLGLNDVAVAKTGNLAAALRAEAKQRAGGGT